MATSTTKPEIESGERVGGVNMPAWPGAHPAESVAPPTASSHDALQALLAFSSLHDQVRRRKALASKHPAFDAKTPVPEFDATELFVLDEVLQLVAERGIAITGADGLAIALAENDEIVLRASAGMVRPDVGARIDRDSAFSGACFRTAQVVNCDDTETDSRVNLQACRKLGARSMVAVPLCGRRRVIGVLEAFSTWPFGFNETDVQNLTLLAELILAALKPEDEDRFAQSAQMAATKLEAPKATVSAPAATASPVQATAPQVAVSSTAPTTAPQVQVSATQAAVAKPAAGAVSVVSVVASSTSPVSPAPASAPGLKIAPATVSVSSPLPSTVRDQVQTSAAKTSPAAQSGQSATAAAPAPVNAAIIEKPEIKPAIGANNIGIALDEVKPEAPIAEPAATVEVAAEPEPPLFGQVATESGSRRLVIPLVLIGIVVVVLAAGGIWWKMKTAQLGSSMVTQPTSPETSSSTAESKPATPSSAVNSAVGTGNPDAAADNLDDTSPASAQELSRFPHVTGIRHWSSPDSSTIVLDLEDQVQYEAHRLTGPDRVYFDLHDTQLTTDLINKSVDIGDAFIGRVRMAQPVAGMTRVVLETRSNTNFSVSLESNPYRLIVEVRKVGTAKAAVNLFPNAPLPEKEKLAIVIPPPGKEDLQLRARVPKLRIVVDAGHGGWDLGTVGRRGLLEKDLVLEIAERLGKLLQSRLGSDVIYTRQDDNYIPLDERAEVANQSQADLFISVHANYSDLPSARGVETYYTNSFSAPGSKTAGSKDADAHAVAGAVSNMPTLSPADLHDRIEQSRRLAMSVQRSLYGTLSVENPGLRDRGIKEAGFVVLTESAMPGILAEVSFVSSPTDEQKLRSDGYRERIAEALYRGVARYAAASKGVKMASAAK
jgi:N-acetylmuramoyl-L-alanine amidase/putative methionine-R-sulfoxide reductase with GAF domain